jgi:DNA-binding MarR family transcriptional regulator
VLRELVETGFVIQREGHADRRQRLLYLTDKGAKLAADVATVQTGRLMRALADSGETRAGACRLLTGILDPDQRREVEKLIARGDGNRRERHK